MHHTTSVTYQNIKLLISTYLIYMCSSLDSKLIDTTDSNPDTKQYITAYLHSESIIICHGFFLPAHAGQPI